MPTCACAACSCWRIATCVQFTPSASPSVSAACLPACQPEGWCYSEGMKGRHLYTAVHDVPLLPARRLPAAAVPKDMQLARRIRGPVYGVCSY